MPAAGLRPDSPVTAAVLGDRLFLFGIYDTGKPPESKVVVVTSTDDTLVWTPWTLVEEGVRPEGRPAVDQPMDVAATTFGDRLYLASRWMGPESETDPGPYVAVDFSGDGTNWSGWRVPPCHPCVPARRRSRSRRERQPRLRAGADPEPRCELKLTSGRTKRLPRWGGGSRRLLPSGPGPGDVGGSRPAISKPVRSPGAVVAAGGEAAHGG